MKLILKALILASSLPAIAVGQNTSGSLGHSFKKSTGTIIVATFTELPKDMVGAGCSFYRSANDQGLKKMVYVDNFVTKACMKINGKLIAFSLIKNYTENKKNISLYQNDHFGIKLEYTQGDTIGDENNFVSGLITLTSDHQKKVVIKVVGLCGS